MILASNNQGKINEVKEILSDVEIFSLKERGIDVIVLEDQDTFEENAIKKAREIFEIAGEPVIADDSGICICGLDNWPGVLSDRFLGENASTFEKNSALITKADETLYRSAFINCSFAYYDGTELIVISKTLDGKISTEKRGDNGFGFDEVFEISDGRTLAELTAFEKNLISPRKAALTELNKKIFLINSDENKF